MPIPRAAITIPFCDLFGFVFRVLVPGGRERERRHVRTFERAFAARYSDGEAVVCCKARMAFYHLLQTMDLKEGAEVVISAIHVADFVNMILLAGFKPVIVDIEPHGYAIDGEDLRRKISHRTGLILVTHLSGYVTDMAEVCTIAGEHGVPVIEDCSQAFNTILDGKPMGTFGAAAIFSLSLLKSVSTINGGVILTSDRGLAARLRARIDSLPRPNRFLLTAEAVKNIILKTLLSRPLFSVFVFPVLNLTGPIGDFLSKYQKTNKTVRLRRRLPQNFLTGFTGAQAVLGLSQLASLDERESHRQRFGKRLRHLIAASTPRILPDAIREDGIGFWLFPVLTGTNRGLKSFLATDGVDSSPMLLSVLSREPAFEHLGFSCPNAERTHDETLFLPMYWTLREEDIEQTASAVSRGAVSGNPPRS